MSITNAQLAEIFRGYHTAQMEALVRVEERVGGVEKQLVGLNGAVARNTRDIAVLPCERRGEVLAKLQERTELSQTPLVQGAQSAVTQAHSTNWTRVWAIVSSVLVFLLTVVILGSQFLS